MKSIYSVIESDVPQLFHVGLQGIAGRHFPIDRNIYYKRVEKWYIAVPMIHTDTNSGLFYQRQNWTQIARYRQLSESLQPAIDNAIATQNIDSIANTEQNIISQLGEITKDNATETLETQLSNENRDVIVDNRRNHLGQTFGNATTLATEPLTRTSELAKKSIGDASENLSQLTGSPVFLVLLGVGGVIALKVLL
jgi:hypothetical protein